MNLLKVFLSFTIVIGLFSLSGMIVRNIHHPFFKSIKEPVLFVVDIPKELLREFVLGIETEKRRLPMSLLENNKADLEFIE